MTAIGAGHWLCVDGISGLCTIGVTARERQSKQRVVVNVRLNVDFSAVAMSDAIGDTVDYRLVSRCVATEIETSSFQLIETLATHLGRTVLARFPRVRKVAMEVWKPGALSGVDNVGAVVVTTRGQPRSRAGRV